MKDKSNVVYTCNEIFSPEKEWNSNTCYRISEINLEDIMLSEVSQTQRTNTVWFHLSAISRTDKFTERENQTEVTGVAGVG